MSVEQKAWVVFAGWVFLFMGLALACDARAHARAAAQWQAYAGGEPDSGAPVAVWAYRLGGAFFALAGAAGLAAAFWAPQLLAGRIRPLSGGPAGHALAGSFFTLCGAAMSALRLWEWSAPRRLPGGLEEEAPAPERTPGARAAFWSGWAVIAGFFIFGSFLLSRAMLAARDL